MKIIIEQHPEEVIEVSQEILGSMNARLNKTPVMIAEDMGRSAFRAGKKCIPVHDKAFMAFLTEISPVVGEGLVYLKAWHKGWTSENLSHDPRER